MAKKDNKDEEYKDENFDNSPEQDDEDFGLPDLDSESESEIKEEDTFDTSESETNSSSELEGYDSDPFGDEVNEVREEDPAPYHVPKKQSAAPIIITLIIILLLALAAVWFIFIKEPKQEKVVVKPVKDTTTYVVEKPNEKEPEVIEPVKPTVGVVNILSARTGRSYVVVGSFFDEDLAKDYANKIIKDGTNAYVIPPFGKSKFNRVAIEETDSFASASSRANELTGQFKEQPWPLKY